MERESQHKMEIMPVLFLAPWCKNLLLNNVMPLCDQKMKYWSGTANGSGHFYL